MDPHHTVEIGAKSIWGGTIPAVISRADRRQHLYVIGKSGTGKTTLLRNMLIQDIEAGEGVALLDPHGDLAQELINLIPPRRLNDVIFFSPSDQNFPIALNILPRVEPDLRHLVASSVVSAFMHSWRSSWGPRLQYIYHATLSALLECQNTTLLGAKECSPTPTIAREF